MFCKERTYYNHISLQNIYIWRSLSLLVSFTTPQFHILSIAHRTLKIHQRESHLTQSNSESWVITCIMAQGSKRKTYVLMSMDFTHQVGRSTVSRKLCPRWYLSVVALNQNDINQRLGRQAIRTPRQFIDHWQCTFEADEMVGNLRKEGKRRTDQHHRTKKGFIVLCILHQFPKQSTGICVEMVYTIMLPLMAFTFILLNILLYVLILVISAMFFSVY